MDTQLRISGCNLWKLFQLIATMCTSHSHNVNHGLISIKIRVWYDNTKLFSVLFIYYYYWRCSFKFRYDFARYYVCGYTYRKKKAQNEWPIQCRNTVYINFTDPESSLHLPRIKIRASSKNLLNLTKYTILSLILFSARNA